MIYSLLILYSRDSENIKNDLLQQLKKVPTNCVCVDDPNFVQHQSLKHPTNSRLQIVFFSPGFLNFLECSPEEAYSSFMHMDHQSTVALFCCGLRETEVMCYHTAPLKSFYSWPKFEASRDEGNERFSPCFLEMIRDVFPDRKSSAEEIIIVPELINKESSYVYVIFSKAIQNSQDLSAQLESSSCIRIIPQNINPYVLQLTVPKMLLETCEEFTIKVLKSDLFLAQKLIRIVKDERVQEKDTQNDFFIRRTSKIVKLEEQLQVLKDIGGSLETLEDINEKEGTILPSNEDMTTSLKEMCKKYGLEELSAFIDEPPIPASDPRPTELCGPLTKQNFCNEGIGTQQDAVLTEGKVCSETIPLIDVSSGMLRSLSLPSVLPPQEENRGGYGDYLPMGFNCSRPPRFPILSSSDVISLTESCVSGNTYVTMKRRSDELNESQEDLLKIMHAFKSRQVTLSEVEKRFQQWQQKHKPQGNAPPKDNAKEDMIQCLATVFGGRKTSDASENMKRFSGSSSQSALSSSDTWRKFSSTSVSSSNSSKTSDVNSNMMQFQLHNGSKKLLHGISTGWIPSYSTARISPPNPASNPPPLPSRRRPLSRSKAVMHEYSNFSSASIKRKEGTYVQPTISDLKIGTNQDTNAYDHEENNSLESLIQICEKYGLGSLVEYFCNELNKASEVVCTKEENHEVSSQNETNENCLELTLNNLDDENEGSLRRSLSLPNTLVAAEDVEEHTETNTNQIENHERYLPDSVISRCEEYINSIQSNIYASVQAYISMQNQNETVPTNLWSESQQELLEIMNAFKNGEKTISQVEYQFKEWHTRHMEACSRRDQQLSEMRDRYEKAQKSSTFGLKKFILPKTKHKSSKSSSPDSKSTKRSRVKNEKDDSKRLSKCSYTSTSSGVSDNGEGFKNLCYFNPAYGETNQELARRIQTSKLSSSSPEVSTPPPPLPPRPPLTPVAVLKHGFQKVDIVDVAEAEKSPAKSESGSPIMTVKKKPSPPPKPANLFQKVSDSSPVELENDQDDGQVQETRPESPDYIIPNKVVRASSKNTHPRKWKQTNVVRSEECPTAFENTSAKTATTKLASAATSSTNFYIQPSRSKGTTTATNISAKPKRDESVFPKRPLLTIPSPWSKSKKPEESMFYITRRWSSVPDLHSEPVYLDLLEFVENRNRSISESSSHVE